MEEWAEVKNLWATGKIKVKVNISLRTEMQVIRSGLWCLKLIFAKNFHKVLTMCDFYGIIKIELMLW